MRKPLRPAIDKVQRMFCFDKEPDDIPKPFEMFTVLIISKICN